MKSRLFILFLLFLGAYTDLTCSPTKTLDFTIGLCKCSPFSSVVNFNCKACQVSNCQLCSVGNPNECDICKPNYVLDKLS